MPRPITAKVEEARKALELRLRDGFHRPGDRFLSNRALAAYYNVSYQTAQRLLARLVAQGLLVRRKGSGTYLPGGADRLAGVELFFHARARRPGSFGQRLMTLLRARLDKLGIPATVVYVHPERQPSTHLTLNRLPVIWELPDLVRRCADDHRAALVLHDRPPDGFPSTLIDSVCVDDFTGGACAAQMLVNARRPAIFAGPASDPRTLRRVAGFLSVRKAPVVHAQGWYLEHGHAAAPALLALNPDAVFCCNDRLAESLLRPPTSPPRRSKPRPAPKSRPNARSSKLFPRSSPPPLPFPGQLIGFDDAPIAAELDLSTIAVPWPELVSAALRTIAARLEGDRSAATHTVVAPRPMRRH